MHSRTQAKPSPAFKFKSAPAYRIRRVLLLALLGVSVLFLLWRAVDLQVMSRESLRHEGNKRFLRVVNLPVHRGMITDRHGEPLAISTPVHSVWANPRVLTPDAPPVGDLAALLGMPRDTLQRLLKKRSDREFVYLKRQVSPSIGRAVEDLHPPGVGLTREYRRYYPASEVFAHVIGFTNVDDRGQEGLELAFEDWLRGTPGSHRVILDANRRMVEKIEELSTPRHGRDLTLSLERRLQYLAYQGLADGVRRYNARAGSAVLLDAVTGEVLAMVNQPAYNPNNRKGLRGNYYRNRSATDTFEPGSTVKLFTVACGLELGAMTPHTPLDTGQGQFRVGRKVIRDIGRYGRIDVATVIRKSSNVGAAKIALSLPAQQLWETLAKVGFGEPTGSGFPGESAGYLSDYRRWVEIDQATLGYGYGLSVTALQLARAYAAIAADGRIRPVSFLRLDEVPEGRQVISPHTARQLRTMLESAASEEGTGVLARIPAYRVAGKTGTVHKSIGGGYAEDRYLALFAGMAPASNPRLVMVVMIDEPSAKQYYGGQVAAPIFARVMGGALRLLDIPPDDLPSLPQRLATQEGPL